MIETLSKAIKEQTGPKTPYRRAQYLFLQWSIRHNVDVNSFSTTDLTNFLDKIKNSPDLRTLVRHSRKTAPPRSLSKPAIDISPSLRFIAQIPSSSTAAFSDLNKKTAFLLAMAAFLRPSDPGRISLQDCQVNRQRDLEISIKAPKELRAGQRITKTLLITHNPDCKELCPVLAFVALRDHPAASATIRHKLLVNSKNQAKLLPTTTISTWLRGIVRLSTPQKPVPSVCSLASDLALAQLSKDEEYVDDNASSVTEKSDSPTHIYDQPPIDSPFVSEAGRGASPIQSNIGIKMKHKVFSLTPPNYGLHSPNKPKMTDQQQQQLSSLVDVVIGNTPNVKISEDLLEETTRIRKDQLCNKNLTFLINVLNESFESFVTKIWSFDPPEATPTTEKQFIQAMKYTLTDFHSKASLDTFGAAHERTFFIHHIVPPFTYFGNHTQFLRF
ncbi:hypothetical protein Unana1_02893 [Umbelopsis nana]